MCDPTREEIFKALAGAVGKAGEEYEQDRLDYVVELEQTVVILARLLGPKMGIVGWWDLKVKHPKAHRLVSELEQRETGS